ncbi:substrate-binding periplasmic protein [Kiloniella litopenaei]|uniref:substrate-binding periplasmic protein n=1 Tax=Kiloniella litopenaei TaxID=1549748 RepID=UPI000697254E|nr:transporter substrate-binding domain-containing protein [Kiloniella litopenaei]
MNRVNYFFVLFAGLVINGICSFPSMAEKVTLRIGYNVNSSYPHFLGSGLEPASPPGVSLDILNQISRKLNFNIKYIRRPGRRILHELKENNLDAAFIFSYKPEREEFGVFPKKNNKPDGDKRLAVLSYFLYTVEGRNLGWDGHKFTNLQGVIGANSGYSIVKDLKNRGIKVEEARSTRNNFTKLKNGRIDGVADQGIVADAYIHKNKINNIVKINKPIATKDYFLIFSHVFSDQNPTLRDKIWDEISEHRDELSKKFMPRYLEEYQLQPGTN